MEMEDSLIPIGDAADFLGVSIKTLRRWDESGKLRAVRKSPGGDRFYRKFDLEFFPNSMYEAAFKWAVSETGDITLIPEDTYSYDRSVFQTQLSDFQEILMGIDGYEDIFPLVIAVSGEIGGNSFDHNIGKWPDVHGIFFAYDIEKREIVLADRGVGILSTLRKAVPELHSDSEALNVAFTQFKSGRVRESRGNGLKFVRDVVAKNSMSLRFQSGGAELEIKHDSSELNIISAVHNLRGCIAHIKY